MNERIERLADRAEHYAKQQAGSDWEVEVPYSQKVFRQKFAELIVRECVNRVRSRQMFAIEDDQNVNHAFDLLVYDIESHFGVEE